MDVRSQKFRRVGGKEGWISPVVRRTRGARGRAICWIFAARMGFEACFVDGILEVLFLVLDLGLFSFLVVGSLRCGNDVAELS